MNILSSFTVYTAALHALILILFYLHISGLGYPGLIVFQQTKPFHLQKQAYTSSKQQERHKHSVEITINFSKMTCILSGSPRLHSTLLRRISLCPMVSPNTST